MIAKGGTTMQDYNTIIGSIQMRLNGCQTRSVMDRYKIGSGTLNLIMSRYHANGIPIEELRMMAPKEVENLFYPQKNLQRKDVPLPDFQYYYDRIHAPGSRMNISFCWLDYKEKNPDGYEKSQFYEYFNRFIAENYGGQKVSMAVNRIPGEKMYIDWVGDQPELLTDTETGEIKKVHIFATTLGVSSLIYAEAFPNEKLPCFIEGCAHAVSFYGAVTKYFVPDNLRTAVTKHTKDELILQSTFADLEDFYETIVLPPPARKPKGKPTVENHVRYLEIHLVEKLKEKIYDLNSGFFAISGIAALNSTARSLLRPLLLMVVCPLCFPELFSRNESPASFCICLGDSKRLTSPTSARNPATVITPIPLMASICSLSGIFLHSFSISSITASSCAFLYS